MGASTLAARIVDCLLDRARETSVSDVRIGLGYTAVMLDDGRIGLAYTFRDDVHGGCCAFKGVRPLAGRPATELLLLLGSFDVLEAGVGLACANALANRDEPGRVDGDILDRLELGRDDRVGMVGHFGPLVDPIRQRAGSLTVFERVERPSGILRPQREAVHELPGCHVALVTATSIINHTIDALLDAARDCREVVLLGASTPLLPGALGGRVTLLSGVLVEDRRVLQVVSEGGGMREFGPHVRKVSVRVRAPRAIPE